MGFLGGKPPEREQKFRFKGIMYGIIINYTRSENYLRSQHATARTAWTPWSSWEKPRRRQVVWRFWSIFRLVFWTAESQAKASLKNSRDRWLVSCFLLVISILDTFFVGLKKLQKNMATFWHLWRWKSLRQQEIFYKKRFGAELDDRPLPPKVLGERDWGKNIPVVFFSNGDPLGCVFFGVGKHCFDEFSCLSFCSQTLCL